jgi:hypothetical protein
MKTNKHAALLALLCTFSTVLAAEDEVREYALLLAGYLAADAETRTLELELRQAALELERYAVDQGLSLTLSSGETAFTFSSGGTLITAEPGVTVSSSKWRDTSLSLSAPVSGNSGKGVNGYGFDTELRTGIVTGKGTAYRAALLERERSLINARRNMRARQLTAEQDFCGVIKELLAAQDTALTARGEALIARYDLESKRAGGYGSTSVILKSAELKLRSRERAFAEAERNLARKLEQFAESCGVAKAGIPASIPEEALLRITSFDPARYVELENAISVHTINNLARKSQSYPFTLDGRAGYSWRDTAETGIASAGSSRVSAGADLSAGGVSLGVGVSAPLEGTGDPALTLTLQWKPNGSKLSRIDDHLRDIHAAREQENIIAAEKKFRDLSAEYERKFADLEWQTETYTEEAELFRLGAEEQKLWFERGIIRETDYLDAQTEYLSALNRLLQAGIDRRLYNIEVKKLFVNSGEE